VLEAEDRKCARAEKEMAAALGRKVDPTRNQHAQKMTMTENSDVPRGLVHTGNNPIGPLSNISRGFSVWAAM
jgi:hypothetical protein